MDARSKNLRYQSAGFLLRISSFVGEDLSSIRPAEQPQSA